MEWAIADLGFARFKFGCHGPLGGVAIGSINLWLVIAIGLSLPHSPVYVPMVSGPRL